MFYRSKTCIHFLQYASLSYVFLHQTMLESYFNCTCLGVNEVHVY